MKIYHTETQADYDALMVELEEQGIETLEKEYWKNNRHETVVFVHVIGPYGDSSRTDTTYGSLGWALKNHPSVPITKYKAKADERMKIYHTETQRDFDALMIELEEQGCKWSTGDKMTELTKNWKRKSSETCVRVDKNVVVHDEKGYYTWQYPDVPIIKYKAKVDEKTRFTKENVYKLFTEYRKDGIYLNDLQDEILKLDDTPEKVVVPKYIAEWIQSYLNEGGTPIDVLGSLMSFHASFVDESVIRWFKKNSETMLKALTNGYIIEPEQLYYIPLPNLKTTDGIQQVLTKRSKNGKHYFASRPNDKLKQRYTKDEVAQVPEVYKPYAKPIEEEEE